MSTTKGFSLIELMIVIAIIGILAAIAVPSYHRYVKKAKITEFIILAESGKIPLAEYILTSGDSTCANMQAVTSTPPSNSQVDYLGYGHEFDSCLTFASTRDFNGTGNNFALGFKTTDGESWSCIYGYSGDRSDVSDIVPPECKYTE